MPATTRHRSRRQLQQDLRAEQNTTQLLSESIAELERQFHDPGWIRLTALAEIEFSPAGLVQLRAICRLFAIKNPLIKHALALRCAYVWGQGVEIAARANGRREAPGEQDVNAVVQAFLADEANQRAVTGAAAREKLERALGTDGEIFLALFTRPTTGAVQARVVLADEIFDVITNPEDISEPWYYRRRWQQKTLDPATGAVQTQPMERLHPAVGYRPKTRPASFGSVPVAWDAPILHIRVNEPLGWQRGIPDAYAALDWAKAYKEFLEDWARLMKALSRFAWKLTAKGQAAGQARTKLAAAPAQDRFTREPNAAGATAILGPSDDLEAIPKTGATIDASSGRPLAMMVAAALHLPVTMLLADPGQTGARATAETLDQPTELAMGQRQNLWGDALQRLLTYVITEAVRAPKGPLKGTVTRDQDGRETVLLAGDTAPTVDVTWPDLDDLSPDVLMDAIVKADSTGTVPPEVILRLALTALGVRQVDELVEAMLDEDGNFQWPDTGASRTAPAADAARAGQDPAATGPGSMAPDDPSGDGSPSDPADQTATEDQ